LPQETSVQIVPAAPPDAPLAGIPLTSGRLVSLVRKRPYPWLLAVIYLPAVLICIYYWAFAANRYQSEATFVVRNPGAGSVAEIASLVQGTKLLSNPEDAYVVHEFIRSRDAMHLLANNDKLLNSFQHNEDDFFWSYPPLFEQANDERAFKHYLRFVDVSFDKTTGISTLRVQAFNPHDAKRFAEALLKYAETLINRLNERAQHDTLATAKKEVERAHNVVLEDQKRVTEFRIRESMIDPGRFSTAVILETVARLSFELALVNAQISQLSKGTPQSVQIDTLKLRVIALKEQIAAERQQVGQVGGGSAGFAPLIDEYDKLTLKREFSERLLQSALTSVDLARVEANRQRLFLETISSPSVVDYPSAPSRILWCLASLAICTLTFWLVRTLVTDSASHAGQ